MLAKILTAVAVAATATLAVTSTASGGTPSWQVARQVPGGTFAEFTAMTAAGSGTAWAFDGQQGATAWELTGSTWTKVPFPSKSDEEVLAAGASSASNAWAFTATLFGGQSRALHWTGSAWKVQGTLPQTAGGIAVISPDNVWAFGAPYLPVTQLGAWHYNGRGWTRVPSGHGLGGGSAVSADDVWAYDGTDVANWNGSTWVRTNLAALLPARNAENDPAVTAVYAGSADNVYAIGAGNYSDGGGPTVVLHYNGHTWTRVAEGSYGTTGQVPQTVTADGHGGLWIPVPGYDGDLSHLLHYSVSKQGANGQLTSVTLPVPASRIDLLCVAQLPGSTQVLAGGYTHPAGNPGLDPVAVLLRYGS